MLLIIKRHNSMEPISGAASGCAPADCSPHTHRPSIVLAVTAQGDSCLAGEVTNCNRREKTKPCRQIQEFCTQEGNIQSGSKGTRDPRIREVGGQEKQ